VANGHQLRN